MPSWDGARIFTSAYSYGQNRDLVPYGDRPSPRFSGAAQPHWAQHHRSMHLTVWKVLRRSWRTQHFNPWDHLSYFFIPSVTTVSAIKAVWRLIISVRKHFNWMQRSEHSRDKTHYSFQEHFSNCWLVESKQISKSVSMPYHCMPFQDEHCS